MFLILIGFESLFLLNLSLTSALNFNFLLLDFIYHFLKLYFFFFFLTFSMYKYTLTHFQ